MTGHAQSICLADRLLSWSSLRGASPDVTCFGGGGGGAPTHHVTMAMNRGCHKDAQPFFFLLRQPLSDVWWLPTNRHRLPTNRHRLHTNRHRLHTNRHRLHTNRHRLPTNRHRLPTNRHRLHTNRHRLPTNRHQLPTGHHHRAYWTLRLFFFLIIMATPGYEPCYCRLRNVCARAPPYA